MELILLQPLHGIQAVMAGQHVRNAAAKGEQHEAVAAEQLYLWTGVVASVIMFTIEFSAIGADHPTSTSIWIAATAAVSVLLYLLFHINTWREMKRIHAGSGLNKVLGLTARNMFVFGLFHSLTLILIYAL